MSSKMLHLGCGERVIPGFISVDVRPLPHVDIVTSADKLGMFEDNSVDLIYACHILEHFGRNQVEGVLDEWYRILKPGRILRLAVPDFNALAKVYALKQDIKLVLGPLVGRQDYPANTHRMVFDFPLLKKLLESAGFSNVRRYNWWETFHKDYDDLSQSYIPHMDKEHGVLISLNVECEK